MPGAMTAEVGGRKANGRRSSGSTSCPSVSSVRTRRSSWSRTVDFRITVIIMTSNLGSAYLPVDVTLPGDGAIAVGYGNRAG